MHMEEFLKILQDAFNQNGDLEKILVIFKDGKELQFKSEENKGYNETLVEDKEDIKHDEAELDMDNTKKANNNNEYVVELVERVTDKIVCLPLRRRVKVINR